MQSDDSDLQPLLDTQQNQLGVILSDSAAIDAKALGLVGANIAILIFIGQANLNLFWWQWLILLIPFFVSLGFNAAAVYPRNYVEASVSLDKNPEYLLKDKEDLVLQLISDTRYAIAQNTELNRMRWFQCAMSFISALIGALILLLVLAVK